MLTGDRGLCFEWQAHYDETDEIDELIGDSMPTNAPNFDNQSLRSFLDMVATDHPDELLRIRQPVDTRFDMTAVVYELERTGKSPVIIFEKPSFGNPEANGMPVVTNVAGNRTLLAACLGVDVQTLPTAFRERCQKYIPCELVKDAAWNEVVIEGDDARPFEASDPAAVRDRRRALHHRRPDFGARPRDRRRHDRLSPADAQGEKPPRRLAAFAPPHV